MIKVEQVPSQGQGIISVHLELEPSEAKLLYSIAGANRSVARAVTDGDFETTSEFLSRLYHQLCAHDIGDIKS